MSEKEKDDHYGKKHPLDIPYPEVIKDQLIEDHEGGVGVHGPFAHLPEANHADYLEHHGKKQVWQVPGADARPDR